MDHYRGWGLWATYLDKNIARKNRSIPAFIVGVGIVFLVSILLITGDLNILIFAIPAVALITFLNLRQFRVCSACGKTIHSGM